MNEWELLRTAFDTYDPVPDAVRAAAERAGELVRRASGWTALPLVVAGMRGERMLRFAGRAGRVDVEVESDRTVRLTGVATGVTGSVWVRWPGGERAAAVEADGRFTVAGLPPGPLGIALRRPGRADAVGPWFVG